MQQNWLPPAHLLPPLSSNKIVGGGGGEEKKDLKKKWMFCMVMFDRWSVLSPQL